MAAANVESRTMMTGTAWWHDFFDEEYAATWREAGLFDDTGDLVDGIVERLALPPGGRILDAACGFGRVAGPLHDRGYAVTGIDVAAAQLAQAERDNPGPRYALADMRTPPAGPYDAVINVFTSFGYFCDDAEDLRALRAWRHVLRPGGQLLMSLIHRDHVVALEAMGDDGDDEGPLREEAITDWVRGIREITWRSATVEKTARLRLYTATELVHLCQRAGFEHVEALGDLPGEPLSPATGLTLHARAPDTT
jgi:SAM-dependent methyltransferase